MFHTFCISVKLYFKEREKVLLKRKTKPICLLKKKDTSLGAFLVHDPVTTLPASYRISRTNLVVVMTFCKLNKELTTLKQIDFDSNNKLYPLVFFY